MKNKMILSVPLLLASVLMAPGAYSGGKHSMEMGQMPAGQMMENGSGAGMMRREDMQDSMHEMSKMMQQAHKTKDMDKRHALMQKHMEKMQEMMGKMKGMMNENMPDNMNMEQRQQMMSKRMDMMQMMMEKMMDQQSMMMDMK